MGAIGERSWTPAINHIRHGSTRIKRVVVITRAIDLLCKMKVVIYTHSPLMRFARDIHSRGSCPQFSTRRVRRTSRRFRGQNMEKQSRSNCACDYHENGHCGPRCPPAPRATRFNFQPNPCRCTRTRSTNSPRAGRLQASCSGAIRMRWCVRMHRKAVRLPSWVGIWPVIVVGRVERAGIRSERVQLGNGLWTAQPVRSDGKPEAQNEAETAGVGNARTNRTARIYAIRAFLVSIALARCRYARRQHQVYKSLTRLRSAPQSGSRHLAVRRSSECAIVHGCASANCRAAAPPPVRCRACDRIARTCAASTDSD